MTYSRDFRQRVQDYQNDYGLTFEQTSKHFKVSMTALFRWQNHIDPSLKRNKAPTKLHDSALLNDVEKYPDAYQYERAERLGVCQSAIHYGLKRLNITHKKNTSTP